MKKVFNLLAVSLWTLMTVALGVACQDPEEEINPLKDASLEIALVATSETEADFTVTTTSLKELAYVALPSSEQAPASAEELFAEGTVVAVEEDNTTSISLEALEPQSNYVLYVAGRHNENLVWEQVKSLAFTTESLPAELTAEVVNVESTSAVIKLTSQSLSRYAYIIKTAEEAEGESAPAAMRIFVQGVSGELVNGENTLTIAHLSPNTEYVMYIAAEVAIEETFLDEVITLTGIKTADFAEDIRFYDITYNSMKVDLKVDKQKMANLRHAIKMSAVDYYYNHAYTRAMDPSATNSMSYDSRRYSNFCFTESATIEIREDNYPITEDGNLIEDEQGSGYLTYFPNMAPGQPMVIRFGEYAWSNAYGEGWSYCKPMFDGDSFYYIQDNTDELIDPAPYWTGFYYEGVHLTKEPDLLDTEIKYTLELETDDATIIFEPNPDVLAYCIMPMNQTVYEQLVDKLLLGHEEYLQWFATSYSACQVDLLSKVLINNGTDRCHLNFSQVTSVSPNQPIHLMITAIGGDLDENMHAVGNKQKFVHEIVQLPNYTKPAPTVDITTGDCTSTSVSWNIKCTSSDAEKMEYLVGYEYDWLTSGGLDDTTVRNIFMEQGGSDLSIATVLDAVNTNGYNLEVGSKPDATSYIVVKVTNDEGLVTYSSAVAAKSLPEEKDAPANIPDIYGDWTMTATVATQDVNTSQWVEQQMSCKVTIGTDAVADIPDTLPEEVYEVFESVKVSREEADAYYAQFSEALNNYVEYTVEGQNRVLMNGWNLDPSGGSDMRYATPYELFCSTTYHGYNAESPVKDFGPKWYLEFDQDGNVWAPFNIHYYGTLSGWTTYDYMGTNIINEYHFVAANKTYNYVLPYLTEIDENGYPIYNDGCFPVEISEDKNTITVKGLKDILPSGEEIYYYPNVVTYSQQAISTYYYVVSDLVLTRGYTATETQSQQRVMKQTTESYKVPEKAITGVRKLFKEKESKPTQPRMKKLSWM